MSRIKICGLKRMEDIKAVNEYQPDYIGFVFAKSKRQITIQQAEQFKKNLCSNIKAVGVFVNEHTEQIINIVQKGIIDMVQLHGSETEQYINILQNQISVPIIKAISVKTKQDIVIWQNTKADYLLLDNGAGGSGKTFSWSLIENITKPFFLAGGLNIQNITEALQKHPYAVDISSGVETDGYKDPQKIADIIKAVKG